MEATKQQAQLIKEKGNVCYKKGKFNAAIDFYTEAICLCPTVSTQFTNRALCYMKLEKYNMLIEDCFKAIELDKSNVKAYYLLGIGYSRQEKWTQAVEKLKEALRLSENGSKLSKVILHEVRVELLRAMKQQWKVQSTARVDSLCLLQASLSDILHTHFVDKDDKEYANLSYQLQQLFIKEQETGDVDPPAYFCCPISMEIMLDPVVVPSGVSYERTWIESHIRRNGPVDPITREHLTLEMLRPNVSLRQAIDAYLEENPWAFESD